MDYLLAIQIPINSLNFAILGVSGFGVCSNWCLNLLQKRAPIWTYPKSCPVSSNSVILGYPDQNCNLLGPFYCYTPAFWQLSCSEKAASSAQLPRNSTHIDGVGGVGCTTTALAATGGGTAGAGAGGGGAASCSAEGAPFISGTLTLTLRQLPTPFAMFLNQDQGRTQ